MFRTTLLILLAICSAPAAAETIVPVTIGDTEVRLAIDDGSVRASETLPRNFAIMQAGLPATNHLVEGFVSEADAKQMAVGDGWDGVMLQVQAMRAAEGLVLSDADWTQVLPVMRSQFDKLDADALVHAQTADADQRMSDAAGAPVKRAFGKIGKPDLYAGDATSLRFLMLIPGTYQVNGVATAMTLECAGAIVRLNGKMVYLYAYRRHRDGEDLAAVRTALDRFADRAIALNTGDAQRVPAPAAQARASAATPTASASH